MLVFVLSKEGKPVMPTTPRRARLWLRAKQAHVVRKEPFTVQLCFETTTYTQPITVGVDTGSKTVGIAAITNGAVVFQAEVHLRDDISEKMTQRRQYRRKRRARKTRYREKRSANRRQPQGWLPPSLRSKAQATVKAAHFIASFLPVSRVNVEIGSFDTQKMQNVDIAGIEYQQGELQGYFLREYVLNKWQRKCAYCGVKAVPLEMEHIVPKSRGGSRRASNLTLACHTCNQRKGQQTAEEFGFPEVQAKARVPLRDTAHVSSLKSRVVHDLQTIFGKSRVSITYGYETKYKRIQVLNLCKSHANDAVAIAGEIGEAVKPLEWLHHLRCLPRGQYQRFNGLASSHKCWAPRKLRGFKLYELVEAKGVVGYIGGRREKGSFVIKDVTIGKKLAEVTPRKLVRVARPTQGWMIVRRQPVLESIRKESGASSPGLITGGSGGPT
jgi:5-methylcytosine-specific restriction endonuclease McrA